MGGLVYLFKKISLGIMKLERSHIWLFVVILIGIIQPLYAQKKASKRPDDKAWTLGLNASANTTFGDIKYRDYLPNSKYGEIGWGTGLSLSKYLSPKFAIKSDFAYSLLYGTKETDNLLRSFETKTQMASLQFQINIGQVFNSRPRLYKLSAWGNIGLGYIRWQSILYDRNTFDTLDQVCWNSDKYRSTLMLPLGLNLRYYLTKKWSIDAQATTTIVNSDWLDAKAGGIEYDYFVSGGLGINYHFKIQRSIRKVPDKIKRKKGDLYLLDYLSIDPYADPDVVKISKKEALEKQEAKEQKLIDNGNPFQVEFWVPEKANLQKFQILVSIKKRGITGNGYFRLSLPSGFYPTKPDVEQVAYTRIAYNFDFDFFLPMNLDTLNIPIDISISEGLEGIYPLFIEGEIMNSDGVLFPIKNAQYVELKSGVEYNDVPTENVRKEQKAESAEKDYVAPENVTEVAEESDGLKTYRIQILACRKPSNSVNDFLKKHQINQKVYLWEKDGWWRYSIYNLSSMEEAREFLQKVRNQYGIDGAFIVEFMNGERNVPQSPSIGSNTSYKAYNNINSKGNLDQKLNSSHSNHQKLVKKNRENNSNNQDIKTSITAEQSQKQKKSEENAIPQFEEVSNKENISVYRVEIAVSPAAPIPLRQLQNWVANEKITEWTYQKEYRYTIGRFENEQVARAFLKYVRLQFALPDAHLVETKGQDWLRVVR